MARIRRSKTNTTFFMDIPRDINCKRFKCLDNGNCIEMEDDEL